MIVFLHGDVERVAIAHREALLLISDVTDFDEGVGGYICDGEVAVKVGHTADRSAVHDDAHSDHRFSRSVFHVA